MRRSAAVLCVLVAVAAAGCGSSARTTPAQLFHEYLVSTDVQGDRYRGATSADRLAEFAAEGSPEQNEAQLLGAFPCDQLEDCEPDDTILAMARPGTLYQRHVVVKHRDGKLELMPLYLVRRGGTTTLVDGTGRRYRGGLADFRQHNTLLSEDDEVLTVRDVTRLSGPAEVVVVTGHTPPSRLPWVVAGIVAALLAAAVVAIGLLAPRLRRAEAPDPWSGDA
jgi:hypothetical protein